MAVDESHGSVDIPKRLQKVQSVDDVHITEPAIDNFDQNEATLDGKSTTHAMATVLFYRGVTQPDGEPISRASIKSLSGSEADELQRYT